MATTEPVSENNVCGVVRCGGDGRGESEAAMRTTEIAGIAEIA